MPQTAFQKQRASEANTTHGMTKTPEYRSWTNMRARCGHPKRPDYPYYGGRGITVSPRWQASFEQFFLDMGPKPTPEHTLERKDGNGHYCRENCCWATKKEQARNTRQNHLITFQGETLPVAAWAERQGLSADLIYDRLKWKWPVEKALTKPARRGKYNMHKG